MGDKRVRLDSNARYSQLEEEPTVTVNPDDFSGMWGWIVQRQTAATAYLKSEQLLSFAFAHKAAVGGGFRL